MARSVTAATVAAIALAAFLFVGFYAVDAGIETSQHGIEITNESFTPTAGENVFANSQLARADYDPDPTVRNESTGGIFNESGNYTWRTVNGTLDVVSNSDLANASNATITYSYTGQTLRQTRTTNIIVEIMGVLVPLAFIAFVSMLAIAMFYIGRYP